MGEVKPKGFGGFNGGTLCAVWIRNDTWHLDVKLKWRTNGGRMNDDAMDALSLTRPTKIILWGKIQATLTPNLHLPCSVSRVHQGLCLHRFSNFGLGLWQRT